MKPLLAYKLNKLTAVFRFVRVIPAIVLSITSPPERDAFVIVTDELTRGAVRDTRHLIGGQVEVGRAGAGATAAIVEKTEVAAAAVLVLAWVEHG